MIRLARDPRTRQKIQKIIPVKEIIRSVHLQPLFGKNDIEASKYSFINVLDKWGEEQNGPLVLGIFTDQHIYRLLGPSIIDPIRNCTVET